MLLIPGQGQGRPAFIEPVLCCSYGPPILHTIRMKPTPTSVLFLWLLAGCTGSPDGSVVSRTDSAGVAIVESAPSGTATTPAETSPTDTLFAATGMSDETVLTFIAALQEAVRRSDAAAVAQMVHYPLRVNNDSGSTSVDSAEAFIQQYAELMTPSISELVINARPGELFSSWRGLMFGAGEVWVSGVCNEDGVTCPPGIIALNH